MGTVHVFAGTSFEVFLTAAKATRENLTLPGDRHVAEGEAWGQCSQNEKPK